MHRDAAALRDKPRALAEEWLLTDGAGGYASSTVLLCGTRRYHGLWVPALKPPVDRHVVLAHLEERLVVGGAEAYLSTCEYEGGFYPDGSGAAERFDLDPLPCLESRFRGVAVRREVLLLGDGGGVCVAYHVRGEGPWTLEVAPFLAMRPFHHLAGRREALRVEALPAAPGFRCLAEGMPAAFLWTDGRPEVAVGPTWYDGVLRRVERERGFDFREDLLVPGRWTFRGQGPAAWHVFCSFDPPRPIDPAREREALLRRRQDLLDRAGAPADERLRRLVLAADAFLVGRIVDGRPRASVIAGYPWFGDWGRDAMIALPGLALETGRLEAAEKVLLAFAGATDGGMIPNVFSEETGRPEYNTVDASLWFLQAVAAYHRAGGDATCLREHLWPAALQIADRYQAGTRFGIRADSDGLITAGSPETQLTWMDAKSRGRPVTPRHGKAVEVNALWISGLVQMRRLADDLGLEAPPAAAEVARAREAFARLFWNDAWECLYDCVLPDGTRDPAVRPNQVLAVGLPDAPLAADRERSRAVVRAVRERLLVPRGLRTLAPDDPAYRGRYEGGPDERDAAYHQGTVWPWLLGPYVDAALAVEDPRCARGEAAQILGGLLDAMEAGCLGQIGEIFDGDPPHRPRGAVAQAWSVAAAIHVWRRLEATGGVP